MEGNYPKKPFENLAISLSGGGFRAASFHLGTLTYLHRIKWKNISLIDRTRVISTVSGGTFTGVQYVTSLIAGGTIYDCYKELYDFMNTADLVKGGLKNLECEDNWGKKKRSLINAFAMEYHKQISGTLGDLWDNPIPIREIIFNTTEFSYGLPFRFQKTEKVIVNGKESHGYVGNGQVSINNDTAREVKLADIMAASSCFPLGFEPINFPDDFRYQGASQLMQLKTSERPDRWGQTYKFPIGLMDGGIDDNQGIDSVLLAEARMKNYTGDLAKYKSDDEKSIDLFVISDVCSPFMDDFVKTDQKPLTGLGKLSIKSFNVLGILSLVLLIGSIGLLFIGSSPWLYFLSGILTLLFISATFLFFRISNIFNWIARRIEIPSFFADRLKKFRSIPFGVFSTLLINRFKSAKTMVSDVFLKQIRRQQYAFVYQDKKWEKRVIMNAIYELAPKEVKRRATSSQISDALKLPGEEIGKVAKTARSMGTTLWFTEKDRKKNMLNTLIACGQFTICFNLLEHLEKKYKLHKDNGLGEIYNKKTVEDLEELYHALMDDWKKFKADPFWLLNEINQNINSNLNNN